MVIGEAAQNEEERRIAEQFQQAEDTPEPRSADRYQHGVDGKQADHHAQDRRPGGRVQVAEKQGGSGQSDAHPWQAAQPRIFHRQ